MLTRTALALVLGLAVVVPATAQDAKKGVDAYLRGDHATALREWRPLAARGNAAAQYNLGFMYNNGWGVPRNDTQAVKWYRKAAEQGYASAQFNLGIRYRNVHGVPQDHTEAL